MAVLSDTAIIEARNSNTLGISPFHDDALEPASYDMHLYWQVLRSPTRYSTGREIDLREEADHTLSLEPGRFAAVLTEEVLHLPLTMIGRFGLRSGLTRQGLVAFPGIQVDPGFVGRLAISVFNSGPEPIALTYGAKMFTIEFHTLEGVPTRPYEGEYQGQYGFPDDQKQFILHAQTSSLADLELFPNELASFEFRLAQLEGAYESSRLSVAELAKAQGVTPLSDLRQLAGLWPEDEDIDDFREAVRGWRGRR